MTWSRLLFIFLVASLAALSASIQGGDGVLEGRSNESLLKHQWRALHDQREVRAKEKGCALRFHRYIPSSYEQKWYDHVKEWETNLEKAVNSDEEKLIANRWISAVVASGKTPLNQTTPLPHDIFSHFLYELPCEGRHIRVDIEPIAGLTRNPRFLQARAGVVDKSYMYVNASAALETLRANDGAVAIYIDFGASLYDAGAGGASQKWFVEQFESVGIQFSHIYAFEAEKKDSKDVFNRIASNLIPSYHWYNVPISSQPGDKFFAWRFLKEIAQKQDYVLVKLDIDNTRVEEEIIRYLLQDESLMDLIDEMFWEHHVNIHAMYPHWHTEKEKSYLHDTYEHFRKLRERGIRAHSWV